MNDSLAFRTALMDAERECALLELQVKALRKVLTWIADPSYIGNYSDTDVIEIYRKWASHALEASDE